MTEWLLAVFGVLALWVAAVIFVSCTAEENPCTECEIFNNDGDWHQCFDCEKVKA